MKQGFPGDKEFTIENYWKLPYVYVLHAVANLARLKTEDLHNYERPIAYLAFQTAELNRDKKKRNRPYKPDEFYFYQTDEGRNLPEPKYGAAATVLIQKGLFPSWALFVYKDLRERASNAMAPELLCFSCDDAIILAPSVEGHQMTGMLIAGNEASEQVREMRSPCGNTITVRLPRIDGRYVADEDAEIRILR